MQKIQKLFIALSVLVSGLSQAQTAADWIPNDVFAATSLNLENLKKDFQSNQLSERSFYKAFVEDFTSGYRGTQNKMIIDVLENPGTFSVDISKGLSGFVTMRDDIYFGGFFFGITNATKLKNFIDSIASLNGDTSVVLYSNQLNFFVSEDVTVAWNDEKVLIGGGVSSSKLNFSGGINGAYDEEMTYAERRKVEKDAYLKGVQIYLDELFIQPNSTNFSATTRFKKNKITNKDFWAWVDYGPIMDKYSKILNRGMYGYQSLPPATSYIADLYQGTNYSIGFNFNESDITIDAIVNQGERIYDITKDVYKQKLNKKFFNYLPASTVGFVSVATDLEEAITASFELYKPMFGTNPFLGDRVRTGIELIQLALDEEAVGNIIEGDILLALHELEVGPKKVIKYEMDEEYNYVETVSYKEDLNPKFVIMATVGNEDNFNLILNAISAFGGLEKTESNYHVKYDRYLMRTFGDMYVSLHDGIAFFSNDSTLIHDVIPNGGFEKNNRINKKLQKKARKSATSLVFDPQKLYEGIEKTEKMDSITTVFFNALKNTESTISMHTSKPKNQTIKSQIVISNNDSASALGHIFDLLATYHEVEIARRAKWNLPAIGSAEAYDDYEVYEEEAPAVESESIIIEAEEEAAEEAVEEAVEEAAE